VGNALNYFFGPSQDNADMGNAGMDMFLPKPFSAAQLTTLLTELAFDHEIASDRAIASIFAL
jgi:CheY-like chemotaxis protein